MPAGWDFDLHPEAAQDITDIWSFPDNCLTVSLSQHRRLRHLSAWVTAEPNLASRVRRIVEQLSSGSPSYSYRASSIGPATAVVHSSTVCTTGFGRLLHVRQ